MRNPRLSILTLACAAMAGCGQPASTPQATATMTSAAAEVQGPQQTILAFGDSLFAGYGLADPQAQSYPARLEAALRAGGQNVAIANAGVSGDTTAAGRQRLAFTLDSQPAKPALVLLELGGNDLLRGLPPTQTKANLAAMLDELKRRGIPVALMAVNAPPNYGPDFQRQFDAIYPALAKEYTVPLVPFVTAQVFTDPAMLQSDHVHPTPAGVAALVDATRDAIGAALPVPR